MTAARGDDGDPVRAAARLTAAGGGRALDWSAPVRGLVLDVDDTIIDTQSAMRSSCVDGAAAAWPEEPREVHEMISGWFYDDPAGRFNAYARGELDFGAMRHARYAVAVAAVGLPDIGFATFEAAYLAAFADRQVLFADARPLLDVAAARGVAVCFLTNSGDAQTELKLDAVGLTGRAPVVTTDTLGVGKPDPRLFAAACALAGTSPAETICVGDTLPTDILGARLAGMRAAWLCRPGLPTPRGAGWGTRVDDPGVRVVATLDEVGAWLV